jgi:hypothetical protein
MAKIGINAAEAPGLPAPLLLRLNPDQAARKAELASRLHFAFMTRYNEIRGNRVLK